MEEAIALRKQGCSWLRISQILGKTPDYWFQQVLIELQKEQLLSIEEMLNKLRSKHGKTN